MPKPEKKRWIVRSLIHVTKTAEVLATTPEEAYAKADLHTTLCHQCNEEIDLGDEYAYEVADPDDPMHGVVLRGGDHPDTETSSDELADLLKFFQEMEVQSRLAAKSVGGTARYRAQGAEVAWRLAAHRITAMRGAQ